MRQIIRTVVVFTILLAVSLTAKAQCVANPTGETAIGLKNASHHFLTLYVDGFIKGGVPSGDRTIDFVVSSGEHLLMAEARIGLETVSTSRMVTVAAGQVCTWTVTDPQRVTRQRRVDSRKMNHSYPETKRERQPIYLIANHPSSRSRAARSA
jgi:hypothetical protein